ncbi:uncharacterized protein LOC120817630 [Gasterosteus aculeatus]|uniref:calmegin-like n=1 Tax=Gasterosteus aculeatus aculeatus TaxID=481459 RepID=UPI001A99A9AA|nr:calmegin-like [Gasterosteus aculeatus aculeatus]XP_040029972.1 calmegin-like [Gasterosteus aculeatus aculeatus]
MEMIFVLLYIMLVAGHMPMPVSSAAQPGLLESLLIATQQRPWLWGVYVFAVGLPAILFVSFMWPDKRFGPPDQQYYYKKSDDAQPDDPQLSQRIDATDTRGKAAVTRRRDTGNQKKCDLELKDH